MIPPPNRSTIPRPGRLGLVDAGAAAALESLGWNDEAAVPVLWSLSRSPDPDIALKALVRLSEVLGPDWAQVDAAIRGDSRLRGRLFGVLGSSTAFADHLVGSPASWRLLTAPGPGPDRDEILRRMLASVAAEPEPGHDGELVFRAQVTGPKAIIAMRLAYRDLLLELAARDIAAVVENEPVVRFVEVGRYLADLADAALTAALAVAIAQVCTLGPLQARLGVVAMGKCGARELNYVSDVDVIFVSDPADGLVSRVAGEMMRIGSQTFFEVDAGLRPEGRNGALVRTLDSHHTYYKRWAKTWEFQALLKARPCTGDVSLAREYVARLSPMVWTACERDSFVEDVQAMRRRVEELLPETVRERELKLGKGGLRDVEFAVQLLQLVHGRTDETLRVLSTVDALGALTAGGYIGRDDGANFAASYEFLRLLEHRLQLQRLKRTHTLPPSEDEEAMRWLARAAHVRPDGERDAAGMLRQEIKRQSARVRRLHAKLFYRPLLASITRLDPEVITMSADGAERQMAALGYARGKTAIGHLKAIASEGGRKGQIQTLLLPTLLEWLGETPDPDAGLLHYRRVSEACLNQSWFLRLLRDEGVVGQRLMQVLGSSAYIPELLIRSPEVIKLYADGSRDCLLVEVDSADVAKGLIASAARHEQPDRGIGVARSLRRAELARIASADLLGLLDVPQVCAALSSVWAAVLDGALRVTIADEERKTGKSAPARIAVIGMGRLGGGELGYGSDADVMVVCEPNTGVADSDAVRWATRIADNVRGLLGKPSSDPPLEVDLGLRPEGRNGPMVRTLASYEAYYAQWAQPWEVQALLRAHNVCGDPELGLRFLHMIDKTRYPEGGISADAVREIRRIKARVDAERLPRGADPATHTKLGRGGLADVEWTVQLLQLRYAHRYPGLHNTSTLQTLAVAEEAGLLDAEQAASLREAWLTATRARNALVLVRGKPTDQLPGPGKILRQVAYVAGWRDEPNEFLNHYLRVTRHAKRVVTDVFGG